MSFFENVDVSKRKYERGPTILVVLVIKRNKILIITLNDFTSVIK